MGFKAQRFINHYSLIFYFIDLSQRNTVNAIIRRTITAAETNDKCLINIHSEKVILAPFV